LYSRSVLDCGSPLPLFFENSSASENIQPMAASAPSQKRQKTGEVQNLTDLAALFHLAKLVEARLDLIGL
jgi:hypothetical protein